MNFKNDAEGIAAGALLFDIDVTEAISDLLIDLAKSDGYYGSLVQVSKFIRDNNSTRLDYALKFLDSSDINKEDRNAMHLLIFELYRKNHPDLMPTFLSETIPTLKINWDKTRKNIVNCIKIISPLSIENYGR